MTDDLEPLGLDVDSADRVVNQLRMGIPPSGYVRQFTVGRQDELRTLEHDLTQGMHGRAVLVRANYGGGKTHLLKLVRDLALFHNYAVSFVEVEASKGIRFNRMDQVFAAVCRGIELPDRSDTGVVALFDAYEAADVTALDEDIQADRDELEDGGRWRQPGGILGGTVYLGLRAVLVSESPEVRDTVKAWLTSTNPDSVGLTKLAEELVNDIYVGDPRPRKEILRELKFRRDAHQPSWDGLNSLDTLARLSGYRGLVLLFDEFENVIHGLNNRDWQSDAFKNAFRFFGGDFLGGAYFSVTPDFVKKCTDHLLNRGVLDFPYRRFRELPDFTLSPLEFDDFLKLTAQIISAHAQAFEWDPTEELDWNAMKVFLQTSWQPQNPSRIRLACQGLVEFLDAELDRSA